MRNCAGRLVRSITAICAYTREAGSRWLLTEYGGLDDTIDLTSVGCRLYLREMYEHVPL